MSTAKNEYSKNWNSYRIKKKLKLDQYAGRPFRTDRL